MEVGTAAARRRIIAYLDHSLLAVLALRDGLLIHQRVVQFGNDASGTVFLRVRAASGLPELIRRSARVSLLVSREETQLESIASVTIEGRASLLPALPAPATLAGFAALGRKSPLLGDIPFADDAHDWRIVRIDPERITLQEYQAWEAGRPPLVLNRAQRALPAATDGSARNSR